MISSTLSEMLALERQILERYENYPFLLSSDPPPLSYYNTPTSIHNKNTLQNNSNLFATQNYNNGHEQPLNNQNIQKKVLIAPISKNAFESQAHQDFQDGGDEDGEHSSRNNISWWWEPKPNSTPKEFFSDSSMHGLKYIAQPKRHLCERIFWLTLFISGIGIAAYLINGVWTRYQNNPVIVSFEPTEVDIARVVFPAVTICNMNRLRKSVIDGILNPISFDGDALNEIRNARTLCEGQTSFANYFGFAHERGRLKIPGKVEEQLGNLSDANQAIKLKKFIKLHTLNCSEIIRLCRWAGEPENCKGIFKEVITQYGKCCTFNALPLPLLERDVDTKNARVSEVAQYTKAELSKWSEWDRTPKFIMDKTWNDSNYPRTQKRAGSSYGLSIAVSLDLAEYYCPSSDSQGFRIMFHSPLESPEISSLGLSVGLGHEIFMKVIPEIISADEEIKMFSKEKRLCNLRSEGDLIYYQHYSKTNCINECVTKNIVNSCNCSYYYMPHKAKHNSTPCDPALTSGDVNCSSSVGHNISESLKNFCGDCTPLCADIVFRIEQTSSTIQPGIWEDVDTRMDEVPPDWAKHNISIIHIFYGDLSTVPKIRKALYGIEDIIANIGGLLGLCLGFSVLSAVEIIYFFTFRACMKKVRKETLIRSGTRGLLRAILRKSRSLTSSAAEQMNNHHNHRTIRLDKNAIELRPSYNSSRLVH